MIQLKRTLTLLLISTLSLPLLRAQQATLPEFLKSFQEYQETLPTEKVFLHLDKSEYAQAETIWMKSYLVAGAGHVPSPLSKNIYVELLTDKGALVKRLILKSEEGLAKASFVIPRNQAQGQYYLRAYTNWMRNQDQSFFYNKKIRILSTSQAEELAKEEVDQAVALKFYPEGGDLVKGLPARLAFEVTGLNLSETQIKGQILNEAGEVVKDFTTQHDGRGMIPFVAESDHYTARLEGLNQSFEFPAIQENGQTMSVNNKRDDFLTVSIKNNETGCEPFYLVAHTRGYITYASETQMSGSRAFVKIDKSSLPSGITHLTLFNSQMQPLAERLAFIDQGKSLNIAVNPNKQQYDNRELATVGIKVTDDAGNPVQGSFSLSAFNSDLVQNDQTEYNIRTNLLLTSDLKGFVRNPGQYFDGTDEGKANLDLLMMVNGWRRFNWKDIQSEVESVYPVEQSLRLEGTLTKASGGKVKEGKVLLLNGARGGNGSRYVFTDEEGRFSFEDLDYKDTTFLRFQGFQRAAMKNVKINIDTTITTLPLENPYYDLSAFNNPLRDSQYKEYAKTSIYIDSTYRRVNGITYLGDVTVVADKREEKQRVLRSQYGKGEAFMNFDEIPFEQKSGRDPYQLMVSRIPGFSLQRPDPPVGPGNPASENPQQRGGSRRDVDAGDPMLRAPKLRQGPFIGTPLVLIDNIVVPWDLVYSLQANEIDYVEVYKSGSGNMFGTSGFSGALAIYTLKGEKFFQQFPKKGLLYTKVGGYHEAREFYAPSYDSKRRQRYIPDQRATVFWAPMVTTDENGEASIKFYTPDDTGYITIDVQGVSADGKPGTGNSGFSIRSNF